VKLAQIAADREREDAAASNAALAARLSDVANARAQTIALAGAKSAVQWAAPIMSVVVLITFGSVMWLVLTHSIPAGGENIATMLLGSLSAMASSVTAYWVGSSAGSDKKTDMLFKSTPPAS
jgi:hypothetical protein